MTLPRNWQSVLLAEEIRVARKLFLRTVLERYIPLTAGGGRQPLHLMTVMPFVYNARRLNVQMAVWEEDPRDTVESFMENEGSRQTALSDEYLRTHTVGELKPLSGPIVLVDYDPKWPEAFRNEAEKIGNALGRRALKLEHRPKSNPMCG